ncbi:unnamed protein product [Phytophthora fragariaefolia]|uniref:Unnamed protein product n=1 Tax=Phytophthora fragariaefolia TaxID=1490495 RepID=A0A9W6XA13_9STRA|nr:unnamed protein product [Phytophthora fragariaefolia]
MDIEKGITTLDQAQFTIDVLRRFGMDDGRSRKTPMDKDLILYKRIDDEEDAGDAPYRQAVGALLYLARVTRPDIMYAVNQVAAHSASPSKFHWTSLKNILRYLRSTVHLGLVYKWNEAADPVRVFTDADWANNEEDRRSESGCLVQVYGCSASWQTKRQRLVSKSSTIAEYIAADEGVEEAQWPKMLLNRMLHSEDSTAIPAMIDNKSTITRLKNGKNSEAQKTIDCEFFSIRDAVNSGALSLTYCPTTLVLADGLSKALGTTRFRELREAVGVMDPALAGQC